MKKINKTFSLILAMVLVLSAVMPAFASEGDKVSLDSVVVKLDDGRLVKVNLEDYALAFLMENDLFDFLRGDKPEPEIIYVSSADKYIDLEEYATNFMFNGGNEEEAINDAEAISEEIVNTFFIFKDFDEETDEPILEPIVEPSDDVAEKVEEIQTLIAGLPEVEEVTEENLEEIKAKIQEIETLILELIELDEDYPVETLDGYEEKYLAIDKRIDEIENPIIIEVVDVSAINDVNVEFGTKELELPATVEVTLSNEETDVANIEWNTENYNPELAGEQVLNGTLVVPEGKEWTIPEDKLAVTVKVIVGEDTRVEVEKVETTVGNDNTVVVTFAEALAEDFDLTGKTITLTAGEATLTATYEADSYLNGVANFVLAKDEALVDAVEYTVSADWAKFATDKFVAKIVAPYIKTVEVTTESVPAVTYKAAEGGIPASGITTIYFAAKDQYGNDIALTNTNVANLKAYATLNGMPLKNDELDSKVDTTGTITIKKTLAEGSNLVVTFKNKIGEDTVVVGTKEFTVAKAATAVPTTLGKIKAVYTDGENQGKEVKSLAANDKVTLSVPVVDQFGNPMTDQNVRWFVEAGKDYITAPATPVDAVDFTFTAKSAGDIVISAFLENGQKAKYEATIGAAKLQTLTYSEELKAGFNNEEIVLGKIEPNQGATLTPEMIKFDIKAEKTDVDVTKDDVVVSARLRGGDDKDTAKDIVIVAKSSKVGTYKITPYVGESFTDENVIKAGVASVTTTVRQDVAKIELDELKENELTAGGTAKVKVVFTNKHGEEVKVPSNITEVIDTSIATINIATDSEDKTTYVTFTGVVAGTTTLRLIVGTVESNRIDVKVAEAAELKTVELGANITSGVIAGKLNDTPVDPFVRIVEIKDQYGNDFIPTITDGKIDGLITEVSTWENELKAPTAKFAHYNYNTKKEMVVEGLTKDNAEGVVLLVDANESNNTVDKIATITVKAGEKVLDTVNVTVKAVRKVDSVTLTPVSTNLALGGTTTLKVEVKDQYGDLFQVDTTKIAKSDNDVVELGNVTQAKDDKNADIKGAYTISVKGIKAGTQEVKIDVTGADEAVLASAKVTFTVKAAGETIDSIVIDKTGLASLYSTKDGAAVVDLTAIAKDANGNVVAVPNTDLMWSAVGYDVDGEVVADAVTSIVNGKLTVKADFVGTVEVKVMTANLKEDTVVLNFDNADPEAVLSTLKVATTVEDKTVLVKSPVEIKKGEENAITVFLVGLDQYGDDYIVDKDVTPFSENTAVASAKAQETDDGTITITGLELGTTNINLIYKGTAYSITVEVVEATQEP